MKKEKVKLDREQEELKSLGSELGSFGLEPPKRYRREQETENKPQKKAPQRNAKKPAKKNTGKKPASASASKKQAPQKKMTRQELNKLRQKKKKIRTAIVIIVTILVLAIVLGVLSVTVLFKIDKINVTGNERYDTKQVLAVLPIEPEKNLLICDIDGATEKLEKNLPYIYNVEIERKLPSTLNVKITEAKILYSVKNADRSYALLDDKFKVVETSVAKFPQNKTIIAIEKAALASNVAGETATFTNAKLEKSLSAMTLAVSKQGIDKITKIYSTDVNNNFLVYDDRITIKVGNTSDITNKLYSAMAAIDKLNESNPEAEGEMTATGGKQVYFTATK